MDSYFYTHVFCLLNFTTNNMVSFNIKDSPNSVGTGQGTPSLWSNFITSFVSTLSFYVICVCVYSSKKEGAE